MHNSQLKQVIREVDKETPDTLKQMDPAVVGYIRHLAIQNKLLSSKLKILEANNHSLLLWHHNELKKTRKDPENKRHYMEKFMYFSKSDVEIVALPRV